MYYHIDDATVLNPYGGGSMPGFPTSLPRVPSRFFSVIPKPSARRRSTNSASISRARHCIRDAVDGVGPGVKMGVRLGWPRTHSARTRLWKECPELPSRDGRQYGKDCFFHVPQ